MAPRVLCGALGDCAFSEVAFFVVGTLEEGGRRVQLMKIDEVAAWKKVYLSLVIMGRSSVEVGAASVLTLPAHRISSSIGNSSTHSYGACL